MNYSAPSTYRGTNVHHGYATAKADPLELLDVYPEILAPEGRWITKTWFGKLDPGGFIIPHIDQGPWTERWHYPIESAGWTWQQSTGYVQAPTEPFPIRHWEPHAVWNDTDRPRVHLLVEYDNSIDLPHSGLVFCDMLPEVQAMLDAIQTTRV
jgi:hypothetical protein